MAITPPNPFQPNVTEPGGGGFALPARQVEAGRGVAWITEAWPLFKAAPLQWIVALVILAAIQLVLGLVPFLGDVVSVLIGPVLVVGLFAFTRELRETGAADFARLFIGFREKLGPLLTLGALYFLLVVLVFVLAIVAFVLVFGSSLFNETDPERALDLLLEQGGLLALVGILLFAFALLLLTAMAYWYAPGLVFYADMGAIPAMQASFAACLRNWLPLLVYGVVGLLVLLLGGLALLVGLAVAVPLLMASYYLSFEDLFGSR
ncbi:MAG TPA: BPSS1780 family membrane protein [Moraxellaceae bacterium]